MWTPATRAEHNRDHLCYGTDVTNAEWEVLTAAAESMRKGTAA
jgi:hypothetical protein